ncbi:hypothetical protein SAMN06265349_102493 [Flavobacterium resistens]|uniref:TonB-dependent Receptor Plug Domain n=1 Tax=Flavobacterium resistens TaxID=443612 RepID=A0A521CFQ0_9FLAO|nr:hypothetical protein [Flavobacterium resistens]MRX66587.1 hypothetical protein [Flavobacterium resistens]SMO58256.1 hypothetical protein SAMN06265349_102493 [Flavobacterium resistens]
MGKLNIKLAFLLLLVNFTYKSTAQNNTAFGTESVLVKTNTSVVLTGETLYYQLYCLNKNTVFSDISEVAYLEVINDRKESVYKTKVSLKNGIGSGDYFIPTTLTTGNYKLIAYTNWMLNNNQNNFFEKDLTIVNPFQEHINMVIDSTSKKSEAYKNETENTSENIPLNLDKGKYLKREKATLLLPKTLDRGNYFLNIRKIDFIPEYPNNETINANINLKENITVLPETRGEIITGFITPKVANSDLNAKIVTLSIPGKNFIFKTTKTNSNGKFIFLIDKQTNTSDCYVQLSESDRENYSITIDKTPSPDLSNLIFSNKTSISSRNLKAIQERSLASQVENVYFSQKKDSLIETSNTDFFFQPTEKKYNLDDFERFRTFKETIVEIVTELNFKDYNQVPSLYLRDIKYNITQSPEPCLVLVDGLQIQNINALLNYNAFQIESISVVDRPYCYGPKIFNGIVSIITKNKDFATIYIDKNILKTTILRPEPAKVYFEPKHEAPNTRSRIPDYRYQLLWKPNIAFKNSEMSIPFYASDISGDYEIILEGLTETGKNVRFYKTFKIE